MDTVKGSGNFGRSCKQATHLTHRRGADFCDALKYFASLASIIVYNIFFHPLKRFPGPTSWAASRVPWATASFTGNLPYAVADLHSQYGPVVRTAPDELSLIDPLAWKDIMGAHKHRPTMQKDSKLYDLHNDPC
jgi:hypothetical protein